MTPKTLWHYTDSAGAQGILTTNTLWATSMSHLNDTGELEYGLNLALEEISTQHGNAGTPRMKEFYQLLRDGVEAAKNSDRFYVACTSTENDDLSQWRAYGRGGGYALGIAVPEKERRWVPYMPEPHEVAVTMEMLNERLDLGRWRPVEYRESKQRKILRRTLTLSEENLDSAEAAIRKTSLAEDGRSAPEYLASMLSAVTVFRALYFKQAAFVGEHEHRIVLSDPGVDNIVQFRSGPFGITPYLRITPGGEGIQTTTAQRANSIPFNAVMVGPSAHATSAQRGMQRLLRNQHLTAVEVNISGATFRTT